MSLLRFQDRLAPYPLPLDLPITNNNFADAQGFKSLYGFCHEKYKMTLSSAEKLHATKPRAPESNGYEQSGSEVRRMRERFSVTELSALRNDLLQGGLADSREAAELVQVFLMGRGYGVSPQAAYDAVSRVEMAGCALPVLEKELEGLALVM